MVKIIVIVRSLGELSLNMFSDIAVVDLRRFETTEHSLRNCGSVYIFKHEDVQSKK